MRKLSVVGLSLAVAVGGFIAGRLAPSTASSPATQASRGRAIRHYGCPMHPTVKSDRPGAAPCCGMALEPVHEGGLGVTPGGPARPAGTVAIDAGLRQLQGVKVGAVEMAPTTQSLRLFGRVAPDETRLYSVNAAVEGSIQELSGVTSGSFVRTDQWLGAFFSAEMRSALQSFITALDVIDLDPAARITSGLTVGAGSTPNRNALFVVERLRGMGMSTKQLEEVRRSRSIPIAIDIRAPAAGLVLARSVTPGQKFEKGMEWFRIANLDRVWILADLLEGDAPLARPGATATVTVPGRPEALIAVVSKVPPQFDAASRTMKVRLELDNPGALLRPDMYVDVALTVERPAAVTVPADAVLDSGLRKTVFVEVEEGVYQPRAVETGWRAGERVEVVRGLQAGERIVLSGTFLVDSESQLRQAAAGGPANAAAGPVAPPAVHAGAAKDPICGMEVDAATAAAAGLTAGHQGRHYAFCSASCRARFLAAPGAFASASGHGALEARAEARP